MNQTAISNQYRKMGVDQYYQTNSDTYTNPHSKFIEAGLKQIWEPQWRTILDLACGEGLITKWIMANQDFDAIEGVDKYMAGRYRRETGCKGYDYSFKDFVQGKVIKLRERYDIIIISYAIDLLSKSYQLRLFDHLQLMTDTIMVIRPNNHLVKHWAFNGGTRFLKSEKARLAVYKVFD